MENLHNKKKISLSEFTIKIKSKTQAVELCESMGIIKLISFYRSISASI